MAMFLAFAVNIPSLVIFVVKAETAFYEKYTSYVSALSDGTLCLPRKERSVMTRALLQERFFMYEVQLILTVALACPISAFFSYLDASIHMLHMFVMPSLGLCAVFCMYFTIVVFCYFSDYWSAYQRRCLSDYKGAYRGDGRPGRCAAFINERISLGLVHPQTGPELLFTAGSGPLSTAG